MRRYSRTHRSWEKLRVCWSQRKSKFVWKNNGKKGFHSACTCFQIFKYYTILSQHIQLLCLFTQQRGVWIKMLSLPAKLCMSSSEGAAVTAWGSAGLFTAIPIIRTRINAHICLIHSGLLSHKMKQKAEKKRGTRNLQRMFHLHHDPKSGHNLCCHKFTPLTKFTHLSLSHHISMLFIEHMQQKLALFV